MAFVLSIPALAFAPPDAASLDPLVRPPAWIIEQSMDPSAGGAATSVQSEAVAGFLAQSGGRWRTPIDRRTGKALLFQGSGIPMLPGAGNSLTRADLPEGVLASDGSVTLEGVEPLARGFLEKNRALFLPDRGDLVLNKNRSGILDEGRVIYVDFDWSVDGVPVTGASVFVRINNGNLVQAGTRLIGRMDAPTTPRLGAADALRAVFAYANLSGEVEDVVEAGRLMLLPLDDQPAAYEGAVGSGVHYRLVWEVAFRRTGEAPTWTARIDALSGEIVEFFDSNQYFGQVTGGVYPRTVIDQERVWPFPFASVSSNGSPGVTDINGRFLYAGGDVTAGLNGRFFDTSCQSCTTPVQPFTSRTFGTGILRFGTGGLDAVGNGTSSRADRNAFYHLNIVRLVALKWLSNSYLTTSLPANVNITSSCNAFFNGSSVNFYRSSGTCNNTGEISDVMQHEWGHGLDGSTAPGDGATGEATADTVGVHVTHSNLLGPYFNRNGAPVRNLDKSTTSKGLLTVGNVSQKCPGGSGPLGREVHCEGEIYGQTTWDLGTALVAKYGTNTGWRESEHIFFTAMPQSVTYLPNQSGSIYDAYLAADDDDGNLENGTPNGGEIYTAFNTHQIASGPSMSTPYCARPSQPIVTATAGCDQIALSWSAVPGATSYRVQKHWSTVPSTAFLNVATVTGTSYTDTQLTPGIVYHYVVQAVTPTCESLINTETLASPTGRPVLDVASVAADDVIPGGNHSGDINPGESFDLTLTLENTGAGAATGITSTVTSATPGVTVTTGTASYPDIAPGATGAGSSPYRIAVSGSVPCGAPIYLNLSVSAQGNPCALETNVIRLDMGTATVRVNDSFETSSGWAHDAASSTATTGAWIRGNPAGTTFQPEDDVTQSGTNCWYTASNTGGSDTTNDVDGGQVTLLSPVMDLSGVSTARLTYWRWFGQRDLGDDPTGDYYVFEASNNGGSTWTQLESLGDNVNAAFWTEKEMTVESFLPLTNNMRFRVRVSDANSAGDPGGDIIEAAIDEFKIASYTCDVTPPCSNTPTFGGLSTVTTAGDCGGTDLTWPAASSNCQNATMSYAVYRSTTPGFVPSPSNRVASGVPGLGFHDSLLVPGTTYYYIVRANDSRSGEDANTVRRSILAATGVDAAAPIFGGAGSATPGAGCGETDLAWAPASENCSNPVRYRVYRSIDYNFTPGPTNLVAQTTSTSFADLTAPAGGNYTYIVRAVDTLGNEEENTQRVNATSTVLARTIYQTDFESGPAGWTVGDPNTATSGNWELGDPVGTGAQPEDDTTPGSGVNCWVTGLAGGGLDANDVDDGVTTLISPIVNLAGLGDSFVRYERWYSNDQGPSPDTDTLLVQVSSDGGNNWSELDSTTTSTGGWQLRQVPLSPFTSVTSNMRFRFLAQDQPVDPSITEAAIDDFEIVAPTAGCSGCPAAAPVGTIYGHKAGSDVVLDWTADPVSAPRYVVYSVTGPSFNQPSRLGTTTAKSFAHEHALQLPGSYFYFVSAVNSCGQESAFDTEP